MRRELGSSDRQTALLPSSRTLLVSSWRIYHSSVFTNQQIKFFIEVYHIETSLLIRLNFSKTVSINSTDHEQSSEYLRVPGVPVCVSPSDSNRTYTAYHGITYIFIKLLFCISVLFIYVYVLVVLKSYSKIYAYAQLHVILIFHFFSIFLEFQKFGLEITHSKYPESKK